MTARTSTLAAGLTTVVTTAHVQPTLRSLSQSDSIDPSWEGHTATTGTDQLLSIKVKLPALNDQSKPDTQRLTNLCETLS